MRDGHVFSASGRIGDGLRDRLIDWWLAGGDAPIPPHGAGSNDDVGNLVIIKPGSICGGLGYICQDWTPFGSPTAWGTGGDVAVGAMEAGCSAMEAVLIAMKHDAYTGGDVEFVDTLDLDAGVQQWATRGPGLIHAIAAPVATVMRAITVHKPRPGAKAANGSNIWSTPCTGRLVLGTGCGACLRCNREWYALVRQVGVEHTFGGDHIQITESDLKAALERAPVEIPPPDVLDVPEGRPDGERDVAEALARPPLKISAKETVYGDPRGYPDAREMARPNGELIAPEGRPDGDGVSLTSIVHSGHPDGPLGGWGEHHAALNSHVEAWNAASAEGNHAAMKRLDDELRGLIFPPDVQLVIDQDPRLTHARKVIKHAPAQPTA